MQVEDQPHNMQQAPMHTLQWALDGLTAGGIASTCKLMDTVQASNRAGGPLQVPVSGMRVTHSLSAVSRSKSNYPVSSHLYPGIGWTTVRNALALCMTFVASRI